MKSIPILDALDDWPEWNRQFCEYIVVNNLSSAWDERPSLSTARQHETMLEACRAIRSNIGPAASHLTEGMKDMRTMYNALSREYSTDENDAYVSIVRQFRNINIRNFVDIKAYIQEFKRLAEELEPSEEPFLQRFVNTQFLLGLNDPNGDLLALAKDNNAIVPEHDEPVLTLQETICLALGFEKSEETWRASSPAPETAFEPYSEVIGDERVFKTKVKYCVQCHADGHTQYDWHRGHVLMEDPSPPQTQPQPLRRQKRKATSSEANCDGEVEIRERSNSNSARVVGSEHNSRSSKRQRSKLTSHR
ncbi:MAG: hypothetical protein Q9174_002572 [Haloplaca sp. 1 TL-2023]